MVFEALKDFMPYQKYEQMATLPPQVPPWEIKKILTGWDAQHKRPGGEEATGVSISFGETYCRYPGLGGHMCGKRYHGRGALQYHVIHDHGSQIEGTKKGKPYGATIIKIKQFYSKILEYDTNNRRAALSAEIAKNFKAIEAGYDSGCDEDHTRDPELHRMQKYARGLAKKQQKEDTALASASKASADMTDLEIIAQAKISEYLNSGAKKPAHCFPRAPSDIIFDEAGLPLFPLKMEKSEWQYNQAAALRILKMLGISPGPCDVCVNEGKKMKNCVFADGCGSIPDFSDTTYKPGTGDFVKYKAAELRRIAAGTQKYRSAVDAE